MKEIILNFFEKNKKYSYRKNNCGSIIFELLKELNLLTDDDICMKNFQLRKLNKEEVLIDFCDNITKFEQKTIDFLKEEKEDVLIILTKNDSFFTNHVVLFVKNVGFIEMTQKDNLTLSSIINYDDITRIYSINNL